MGVENYVSTIKLTPITDGNRTFAEWSAEFDTPPGQESKLAMILAKACSRPASPP